MAQSNAAYVRSMRKAQARPERLLAKRLRPVLVALCKALAKNAGLDVSEYRAKIAKTIEQYSMDVGVKVSEIEAAQVPQRSAQLPMGWRKRFMMWAKNHAMTSAAYITSTTVDTVREALAKQIADNEVSAQDLAARVVAVGASPARAMMIARTEIATASNYSSAIVADEFGLAFDSVWLSAADERTRPDHVAANGKKADRFGFFEIGGFQMKHPCDSDHGAPAAQIVNCRCAVRRIYKL